MGEVESCAGMWSQWRWSVSLGWARRSQETLQLQGSTSLLPALSRGVRLPPVPQPARVFSPTQDLRTGVPRLWLRCSLPGQVPTQEHEFWFRCFSSLHYMCMFQPGLYRSSSASFWLIFSENCSTCRCIFDVFMEGDEFHILLLCHLGLNSGKSTFLNL